MCLQVSFLLYLNQSKLKLSRTPGVLILFLKGELCTAVTGLPPFLTNRFFFSLLLNGGYELQGTLKAIPWTKNGDWVNYVTEKKQIQIWCIYFLLLRYAVLFTTSFSPQNSYVSSFVLANLWQDCESKLIYLHEGKKGNSFKDSNIVN